MRNREFSNDLLANPSSDRKSPGCNWSKQKQEIIKKFIYFINKQMDKKKNPYVTENKMLLTFT